MKNIFKICSTLFLVIILGIVFFAYHQVYKKEIFVGESISFEVMKGESVNAVSQRLEQEKIISNANFFKLYIRYKGLDTKIQSGLFHLSRPFTLAHIANNLADAQSIERSITIVPGWDLRDIAEYFETQGIASSTEFFAIVGMPAKFQAPTSLFEKDFSVLTSKPKNVSLEGYFAPETYRIFQNENLESVLRRLIDQTEKEFSVEMLQKIQSEKKSVHEILTLASIVEKEVKTLEDKKKVADIFWRRMSAGWGLQADSTVHYLSGREGDVFTKAQERQIDSLWNTYKYRGLPPGPIGAPSKESIEAVLFSTPNDAWYFLTTADGEVKYGRTLAEQNANVQKYLR